MFIHSNTIPIIWKNIILTYTWNENFFRRIAKRDIENARQFSNSSFAKALLDVADDIERALASVPKEQVKSLPAEYQSFKTFYEGIEMTNKTFLKVFQQVIIFLYHHYIVLTVLLLHIIYFATIT